MSAEQEQREHSVLGYEFAFGGSERLSDDDPEDRIDSENDSNRMRVIKMMRGQTCSDNSVAGWCSVENGSKGAERFAKSWAGVGIIFG